MQNFGAFLAKQQDWGRAIPDGKIDEQLIQLMLLDEIKDALDEAPPEIIADLMDAGICLAGGAAQLQALDRRLVDELHIRVWVAEDPMSCVARGAGMILEEYEALRRLLVGLERGSTRHN